jgi:hypothetical protein
MHRRNGVRGSDRQHWITTTDTRGSAQPRALLGRTAAVFDVVYACFLLIVLSLFGAGEIGHIRPAKRLLPAAASLDAGAAPNVMA